MNLLKTRSSNWSYRRIRDMCASPDWRAESGLALPSSRKFPLWMDQRQTGISSLRTSTPRGSGYDSRQPTGAPCSQPSTCPSDCVPGSGAQVPGGIFATSVLTNFLSLRNRASISEMNRTRSPHQHSCRSSTHHKNRNHTPKLTLRQFEREAFRSTHRSCRNRRPEFVRLSTSGCRAGEIAVAVTGMYQPMSPPNREPREC